MVSRITTIAWNTFTDLVRQKVFYILLFFALFAIGSSVFLAKLTTFQEEFQMLKDVCLGSMSIFTTLLAIFATAYFLPKDIEERTIYTLLSKPVPRFAYLMGKLLGMLLLLFLFILLMTGVFLLVLWWHEKSVIAQATSELKGQDLQDAIAQIRISTFNLNLLPGILIIFIKSALLASLTLFVSTFASSALFTMMIMAGIYFIGHLQSAALESWRAGSALGTGTRLLLGLVALIFPDLQAFNLTDDVIAGVTIPMHIFLETFGLGCAYVAVYFMLSAFVFSNREL